MSHPLAQDLSTAPVAIFDTLDSTNAEARRRAEAGETGPVWILAHQQSAGRGRRGRNWISPVGNLSTTLLMPYQGPASAAAGLSFVVALAVFDLVSAYTPPGAVTLKWPNDVHLAGKKVSGVLIESGSLGDGQGLWLAIGVGVNLAHAPQDVERPATAIADHLGSGLITPPDAIAAQARLAAALDRYYQLWRQGGLADILPIWTLRAEGLGKPCVARLERESLEGVAEGLDADGALRLRLPSGEVRRITAADVFFQEGSHATRD